MKTSLEQRIEELESKVEEICEMYYKDYERAKEEFKEPPKEWKDGDECWYINTLGRLAGDKFYREWETCKWFIKTNNLFHTAIDAQNKLSLINHIAEFKEPDEGSEHWWYTNTDWDKLFDYKEYILDKALFQSGFIMPLDSTEDDRKERERLLKLVYENSNK